MEGLCDRCWAYWLSAAGTCPRCDFTPSANTPRRLNEEKTMARTKRVPLATLVSDRTIVEAVSTVLTTLKADRHQDSTELGMAVRLLGEFTAKLPATFTEIPPAVVVAEPVAATQPTLESVAALDHA